MADYRALEELILSESDDAALSLVRADLQESYEFKKENWNAEQMRARWAAYRGDPSAFDWGKIPSIMPTPVNNLILLQVRHKISKLTRAPSKLNAKSRGDSLDEQTQLAVSAAKRRLQQKADEADWNTGRRRLALHASVQGCAYRAVGVQYEGLKPVIKTFRIRPEEWHMDPAAESLSSARWCAWRRYVSSDEIMDTMRKFDISPGGAGGDITTESDSGITLPDDAILLEARGARDHRWMPKSRVLLTDYWRKDDTMDLIYPCSKCGAKATVGRYDTGRALRPLLECQHCGHMEQKTPPRELFRQQRRYPGGRYIRIVGQGTVTYQGPPKITLRSTFPIIDYTWYETDDYTGMGEPQTLAAPQMNNNLASLLLLHNAIVNTHPKRSVLQGSLTKPLNNDPFDVVEMNAEGIAAGGIRVSQPGDVGQAARILLGDSKEMTYLLAGNDRTATGAQPETVRSGVGIARINAASDIALYLPQAQLFKADTQFFRIVQDICSQVDYPERMSIKNELTQETQDVMYEKGLMRVLHSIEVTGEQDTEEDREAYFSRALQLKSIGDPNVTWSMIEELSGIPQEYFDRAREEAIVAPQPMSVVEGGLGPAGAAAGGNAGAGAVRQAALGAVAPPQTKPPSLSRGAVKPIPNVGGTNG